MRQEIQGFCQSTAAGWRDESARILEQEARLVGVRELVGRLGLRVEQGGAELMTEAEEPADALAA